jgi:hypothetical protein
MDRQIERERATHRIGRERILQLGTRRLQCIVPRLQLGDELGLDGLGMGYNSV